MSNRTGWWWGLGPALLLGLLASGAQAGPEQRCRELGSQCDCSEPLDTRQRIPGATFVDLKDSPDSSECNGETEKFVGASLYIAGGGRTVSPRAEGVPFPPGARVKHVVRKGPNGVSHLWGNNRKWDDGTLCLRSYHRWSEGFEVPFSTAGNDKRIKVISFGAVKKNRSLVLQNEVHHADPNDPYFKLKFVSGYWGIDTNLGWRGPTVSFSDCKESWCRFELCLDHDDSGRLTGRGRIVKLSTGETQQYGPITSRESHSSVEVTRPWIAELFDQNIRSPGEHRYVSYGMQAFTEPADPNFWIGPAEEIEGSGPSGGGNDHPPTPPPEDPLSDPPSEPAPPPVEDPIAEPSELRPPGRPILIEEN